MLKQKNPTTLEDKKIFGTRLATHLSVFTDQFNSSKSGILKEL